MKHFILFLLIIPIGILGQNKDLEKQIPKKKKYEASEVVDEVYGITIYEPLNMALSRDSVRMEDGYAASNWIEDHYTDGSLLHRGYYIEGQLKVYRNYYPNGKIEREFKNIDGFRSTVKLYYKDAKLKSEVKYLKGSPLVWTDYFSNGNIDFHEEYHKNLLYHISRKYYYESGQAKSILELVNKKKLEYTSVEYSSNGTVLISGNLKYSKSSYDYFKTGKWKYYKEDGSLIKEETYEYGRVVKTKTY